MYISALSGSRRAGPVPLGVGGADQPNIIFFSDWSTALGTSDNACTDGGKWDEKSDYTSGALEVVASTGLDFPTTNCLKVEPFEDDAGFCLLRKNTLAVPGVGERRFYRFYNRFVIADGVEPEDTDPHPHQDGNSISDSNWALNSNHEGGGANQFVYDMNCDSHFLSPAMNKDQTYRFEVMVDRNGTTTFLLDVRVYDSSNNLLSDGSDWSDGSEDLISHGNMGIVDVAKLGQFNAGLNGFGDGDSEPWGPSVIYMYQGGVAISDEDWIGPYVPGGA